MNHLPVNVIVSLEPDCAVLMPISGVYQNSVDSGGTANYSVAGTTLTFVPPPPTTATNGIEVVITQ